jgi:diguanylate cyclase (GGDEF)-like protein
VTRPKAGPSGARLGASLAKPNHDQTSLGHISLRVDRDGRIVHSRPRTLSSFGRRAYDVVGKYASDLFAADDVLAARALLHRATRDGATDPVHLRLRTADGGEIVSHISARGFNGRVTVRIRVCDDAEHLVFHAGAADRARFDPLTGLPNRLLLLERARRALRAAGQTLVLVDVDRFRDLISALGTRVGDRILVEVADRLQTVSGPTGIVGLWGREFAVLVPTGISTGGDGREIADLISEVHCAISAPFEANGDDIELCVSVGVASGAARADVETLFADAEVALAHAESLGSARDAVFDPALRRRAARRMELQSDLSRAVADNELRLDFQPIIDLSARAIAGYEALVRWQHPHRGLLAPRDFLGIAQRTGAGAAIDDWVLVEACTRGADGAESGNTGAICVNVAPDRFAVAGFVDRVEQALATTGLDPARLVVEITEWSILVDIAAARDTLTALNALGVRVALDDYGTGYSSLADIAALPVDEIKIDTTFVAGLGRDRARTAIVNAIVGLGHALDITVVAEGVETEAQAFTLRALGCEFGQGYHFGRPAPYPAVSGRTS